jgi:phosphoserine phosphatase RsbU/P
VPALRTLLGSAAMPKEAASLARRRTLARRLLIEVNLVLVVVLGLFVVWDYFASRASLFEEKRLALQEEARGLLISILRLRQQGPEHVQIFMDEVCKAMQDATSPGHHIAAVLGEDILQAKVHGRASQRMLTAMKKALETPSGVTSFDGNNIVVGAARYGDVTVYVSERLSNTERILHAQILRRVLSVLGVMGALAILINVLLHRLLVRPLRSMMDAVQDIGRGNLAARMPRQGTMELGALGDEFNQMALALDFAATERRLRMERAKRIQENLHPQIAALTDVHAACLFHPAAEVGGDYYDVLRLRDGSLLVCVADVTGHDVPAAMGAAMLKALLLTSADREPDPAHLLGRVNNAFCRVSLADNFATMALARMDLRSHTLSFASAGHEVAYLLQRNGRTRVLAATGPVLGMQEDAVWDTISENLARGDRLVILTDGLTEAASPEGEFFGRDRLLAHIQEARDESPEQLCDRIMAAMRAHRGPGPQQDDMTMLVVDV